MVVFSRNQKTPRKRNVSAKTKNPGSLKLLMSLGDCTTLPRLLNKQLKKRKVKAKVKRKKILMKNSEKTT